jgi:hypothetical protein
MPPNSTAPWTNSDIEEMAAMYWSTDQEYTAEDMARHFGRSVGAIETTLNRYSISSNDEIPPVGGKVRPCMTCRRSFFSGGIHNRMCRKCATGDVDILECA